MAKDNPIPFVDKPSIDFVMMANHAEAINGMLYMLGGGWTDHHRQIVAGQPTPASSFSIATAVYVPWSDTNRPISLTVSIENEDGAEFFKFDGQVVAGRGPQLPPGSGQHLPLAINVVTAFPTAGGYRVVVKLEGRDHRTWPFRVHDINQQRLAS